MIITPFNPDREARKCGTEVPHEPTDEFVRQAFGSGARALWPDGRDPGWYVTFDRWLAAQKAAVWDEAYQDGYEDNGGPNPYRADETPVTTDHAARKLAEMRDLRGISTTEHEEHQP